MRNPAPGRRHFPDSSLLFPASLPGFFCLLILSLPLARAQDPVPQLPAEIAEQRSSARNRTLEHESTHSQTAAKLIQLEAQSHQTDRVNQRIIRSLLHLEAESATRIRSQDAELAPLQAQTQRLRQAFEEAFHRDQDDAEILQRRQAWSESEQKLASALSRPTQDKELELLSQKNRELRLELETRLHRQRVETRGFSTLRHATEQAWMAAFAAKGQELQLLNQWNGAGSPVAPPFLQQLTVRGSWRRVLYDASWTHPRDEAASRLFRLLERCQHLRDVHLAQRDGWQALLDSLTETQPAPLGPIPSTWQAASELALDRAWDTEFGRTLEAGDLLLGHFRRPSARSYFHPALSISRGVFALHSVAPLQISPRLTAPLLEEASSSTSPLHLLRSLYADLYELPDPTLDALFDPAHQKTGIASYWTGMQRRFQGQTSPALRPIAAQHIASSSLRASAALAAADQQVLLFLQETLTQMLTRDPPSHLAPRLRRHRDGRVQPRSRIEISLTFSRPVQVKSVYLGDTSVELAERSLTQWKGRVRTPSTISSPFLRIEAEDNHHGYPLDSPFTQPYLTLRNGSLAWNQYEPGPDSHHGFRLHSESVTASHLLLLHAGQEPRKVASLAQQWLQEGNLTRQDEVALAWMDAGGELRYLPFTVQHGQAAVQIAQLPYPQPALSSRALQQAGLHLLSHSRSPRPRLILFTNSSSPEVIAPLQNLRKLSPTVLTRVTSPLQLPRLLLLLGLLLHPLLQAADSHEPNDDPSTATVIQLGSWQEVTLSPPGDRDYFRCSVNRAGFLLPQVAATPIPLRWETVSSPDGEVLAMGARLPVKKGTVWLRLSPDVAPEDTSGEAIRFRLLWIPGAEPSPVRESEITLSPGVVTQLRSDFHPSTPVTLQSSRQRQGSIVWFFARDEWGRDVPLRATGKQDGTPLWLRSGTRPLQVTLNWPDPRPARILCWTRVESSSDRQEPNDSASQAASLSLNQARSLQLYPAGDRDWFSLQLSAAASLRLRLQSREGFLTEFDHGIEFGVTDEKGQPVAQRIAPISDPFVWSPAPFEVPSGLSRIWIRGHRSSFSRKPLTLVLHGANATVPTLQTGPVTLELHPTAALDRESNLRSQLESLGSQVIEPGYVNVAGVKLSGGNAAPSRPRSPSSARTTAPKPPRAQTTSSEATSRRRGLWWAGLTLGAILLLVVLYQFFNPRRQDGIVDLSG